MRMHVHVLPPDMASGHVALFRLPTLPSLHTLLLAVLKKKKKKFVGCTFFSYWIKVSMRYYFFQIYSQNTGRQTPHAQKEVHNTYVRFVHGYVYIGTFQE